MPKWIVRPYGSASGSGLDRDLLLPAGGQLTRGDTVELGRALRLVAAPLLERLLPLGLGLPSPLTQCPGVREDLVGDLEGLGRVEAEDALGGRDLVVAQRRAVRGLGVLGVRRRPGDDRAHRDERRPVGDRLRRLDRVVEGVRVEVAVRLRGHALDVPAVRLVPLGGLLGDGCRRVALDGDVVVVPQQHEVAELLVAGQRGRLRGDALLEAAVTGDGEDEVVEGGLASGGVRVEQAALVAGGHRHADRVGDTLAQRAGGGLHAGGVAVLRVSRGLRTPGPERLQVVQLKTETGQVQLGVEGQGRVARGQHEAVAADPVRVRGVVPHHLLEEGVGGRRQAHRRAGMAVADLLYGIGGQDAGGVHGPLVQLGPLEVCGGRLGAHPGSGLLSTCHACRNVTHVDCRCTGRPGRCRAYPRPHMRFFESFQTAGTHRDPPADWPVPHSAGEYGAAHRSAQSSAVGLFQQGRFT